MSNSEKSFNNPDDHNLRKPTSEYAKEAPDALLFGKLEQLKDSLDAKRRADFQTREFYFNAEMIGDSVTLPESVEQILEDDSDEFDLESISIACAVASDDDPSNISFEYTFHFVGDKDEMVLKMIRPHYYSDGQDDYDTAVISELEDEESDEDYEGDFPDVAATVKNFQPATRAELNRLLASLIYPNPKINYQAFDTHEWSFDNMVDRLADESHSATTKDCYILYDNDGNYTGELAYFMLESVPTEFNIVHTTFNNVPDAQNNALVETDIKISKFEDPTTEMAQYQLTDKNWSINVFNDNDVRFKRLLDFVDSQITTI